MEILIDFLRDGGFSSCGNLGVNVLRRARVGVSEQVLRVLDVNVGFVQQRRVAVTELMRGQIKPRLFPPAVPSLVEKVLLHQLNRHTAIYIILFAVARPAPP